MSKCYDSLLDCAQKAVLLGFAETVYLVDEQYGAGGIEKVCGACPFYHIAYILDAAGNGAERKERDVQCVGYDGSQCGLAYAGGTPQDKTADMTGCYHARKNCSFTYQMLLAYIVRKFARTHSFC